MEDQFIGQSRNGYTLLAFAGRGGNGVVYQARRDADGALAAIKIVRPEAGDDEYLRRVEQEASIIDRLNHPAIVPLYDFWRDDLGGCLATRWMDGGSLHDTIKTHGALTMDDCLALLERIGEALHVAHQSSIVHRDVKPANVLYDEAGMAYLGDFGIARALHEGPALTMPGSILGSPGYIAPEQIMGETIGPHTDLYSLGILTYEALAGRHPYGDARIRTELYLKHLREPMPSLSDYRPDLPLAVSAAVQRAAAKLPGERFESVAAFVDALHAAMQPE
jgi:serine/threonine-protein kinase